jgi:hypothetical protein
MEMKWIRHAVIVAVTIPLVLGFAALSGAATPGKAVLTVDDCVKCHANPPADIAAAGAGHKSITCFDCHASHRPASKDNIPKCDQCHTGKAHYELKGCLGCHKNPHTPLKVSFGNNVTDPCLTCHSKEISQLRENKSKHTNLYCSTCHTVHRIVPQCVQCHKPHAADMTQADCNKCHKAHMPKVVTYGSDIPNKSCGACHQKAMNLLSANKSKHKNLACVFCHAGKHKTVPNCQSCHSSPHAAGILQKFPKCYDCHFIAHDLNNWPASEKKETVKEIRKESKKKK